ncbi:hypothetical protein ACLB2K_051059 [Fragaria x ananassa]
MRKEGSPQEIVAEKKQRHDYCHNHFDHAFTAGLAELATLKGITKRMYRRIMSEVVSSYYFPKMYGDFIGDGFGYTPFSSLWQCSCQLVYLSFKTWILSSPEYCASEIPKRLLSS